MGGTPIHRLGIGVPPIPERGRGSSGRRGRRWWLRRSDGTCGRLRTAQAAGPGRARRTHR
jgi:hypothetical protein